jgi:hypothetical protein
MNVETKSVMNLQRKKKCVANLNPIDRRDPYARLTTVPEVPSSMTNWKVLPIAPRPWPSRRFHDAERLAWVQKSSPGVRPSFENVMCGPFVEQRQSFVACPYSADVHPSSA